MTKRKTPLSHKKSGKLTTAKGRQVRSDIKDFPQQSSHNYRTISRIAICIILIVATTLSIYLGNKNSTKIASFWQLKQMIAQHPNDARVYLQIGKYFEQQNNFTAAKREYMIAKQRGIGHTSLSAPLGVGEADAHLVALQAKIDGPKIAETSLRQWLTFTQEHPNYTDGWVQIAALAYALNQKSLARQAITNVLEQDPTNETARGIGKYL